MKTVILAAGFGSRLWPVSTSDKPKQFQRLINGTSLLKYTYQQLTQAIAVDELYVLGLEGMQNLIREELPEIKDDHIILVPERRNTLPHTLWALNSITNDPHEPVLFKSVDHFVHNPEAFIKSLKNALSNYGNKQPALELLCSDYGAFNTNDGYCIVDSSNRLLRFMEKPSQADLEAAAGNHKVYRSSMTFIASIRAFQEILGGFDEAWVDAAKQLLASNSTSRAKLFLELPFMDISTTIFQKSDQLRVDTIDYSFTDVGRFEELYQLNDKDQQGNVVIGPVILGTVCKNSLIINETDKPLVVMSVTDSVVVQTEAGSLVSPFKDAVKIGEIYKSQIHGR